AKARGAQLIVTVDNGISSHAGVAHAKTLGIPVIVTDHHLPGDMTFLPTRLFKLSPRQRRASVFLRIKSCGWNCLAAARRTNAAR
ncbi:DHH family phosphoesterase, partial [Salmonella enterica subsp. enterica serovar Montevideo]|nr:DHH family phosphoesterase [Salmonella enterica subsp. enterica serovar Montevideo]